MKKQMLVYALILVLLVLFNVSTDSEINSKQDSKMPLQAEYEEITTIQETTEPETTEKKPESLGFFTITAYCSCQKCCGKWAENRPTDEYGNEVVITASGRVAKSGETIAVDPDIIPYGTVVIIDGQEYVAADTLAQSTINRYGGRVIDIYFSNHSEALKWGKQTHEVLRG